VSPKEEILAYLKTRISPTAYRFADEQLTTDLFTETLYAPALIKGDVVDHVALYCTEPFLSSPEMEIHEGIATRHSEIRRELFLRKMAKGLLGQEPSELDKLRRVFPSKNPNSAEILASDDPEVILIRDHLGPGMVLMEFCDLVISNDADYDARQLVDMVRKGRKQYSKVSRRLYFPEERLSGATMLYENLFKFGNN
jgi:hypothetical protein